MSRPNTLLSFLGAGLGLAAGYSMYQQLWVLKKLIEHRDVRSRLAEHASRARPGVSFREEKSESGFTVVHIVEDGVERVEYRPHDRRFQTPILMQHGMWHGAWCWETWQRLFAGWGFESIAISLPGHGGSPVQRPIPLCTLDYYLGFLKAEIDRLPRKPVLMGHSMGGALTQWYLKYVGDDLPAAVLVAPWVSHSAFADGLPRFLRIDPLLPIFMLRAWSAAPMVRSPRRAARALISRRAICAPEELYARLGPESALVLYQHNPPFWYPPQPVKTPMLLVAGELDAGCSAAGERKSAAHYRADFVLVEGAAHNLMMEHNYPETAERIYNWLTAKGIA